MPIERKHGQYLDIKYMVGDVVSGYPLFYNGYVTGTVINTDAGISRDALVLKLDDGNEVTILYSSVEVFWCRKGDDEQSN